MLHCWVFGPVVITVGYWAQVGAETEAGARLEIRRVEPEVIPGAPAGVAGFRVLPVSDGVWRADLLVGPGGPVYHYHPHFEQGDVGQRFEDPGLSADPVGWTIDRLSDIAAILRDSGAPDVIDAIPQARLDPWLPAIRTALEASFQPDE